MLEYTMLYSTILGRGRQREPGHGTKGGRKEGWAEGARGRKRKRE